MRAVAVNIELDTSEIHYLRERAGERGTRQNLETRRRATPWRMADPVYVSASVSPTPEDLCSYSLRGRRVLIVGEPLPSSVVLSRSTDARSVFTDGHFPTVTAPNGATVSYAAQWWTTAATVADCEACHEWLTAAIRREFRDHYARLVGTPATTGRDLWARSLDRDVWPVMSPEAQHFVRMSGGQGRMETYPAAAARVEPLYEYDARMCYVSLLHEMPVGEPDAVGAYDARQYAEDNPYGEARYRVSWQAPDGWAHPGILPARSEGDVGTEWSWPLRGDGWCGGAELFTARQHGWDVRVSGALVWRSRGNPLGRWRDRLLRVIAASEVAPDLTDAQRGYVRNAVRAMILHTIGSFAGAPRKITRHGTADEIPDTAGCIRRMPSGRYSWRELVAPAWPDMVHPEWSVTVWGRARARLLYGHRGRTGMLTVPPRNLVAARTDAVYLTGPTRWEVLDDGKPGRYRLRTHPGGAWPRNGTELLAIRKGDS